MKSVWNITIQSIPRTEPFRLKKIVVTSPRGKIWTFDSESDARCIFPDSWDRIKAGLLGYTVTGV